jgi:hypothetical protein
MSSSFEPHDFDRRRFLKLAGIAGISSLGLPALALAQSKPASGGAPPSSTPAPPAGAAPADSAKAAAAKPPEISEDARSLAAIIQRRYGKHLTPDQLEAVTRDLDGGIRGGRRMRDQKLANADEPDSTFKA